MSNSTSGGRFATSASPAARSRRQSLKCRPPATIAPTATSRVRASGSTRANVRSGRNAPAGPVRQARPWVSVRTRDGRGSTCQSAYLSAVQNTPCSDSMGRHRRVFAARSATTRRESVPAQRRAESQRSRLAGSCGGRVRRFRASGRVRFGLGRYSLMRLYTTIQPPPTVLNSFGRSAFPSIATPIIRVLPLQTVGVSPSSL